MARLCFAVFEIPKASCIVIINRIKQKGISGCLKLVSHILSVQECA